MSRPGGRQGVESPRWALDRDRLERAFEAGHTTSPAGVIAASTDAARALLARHGHELSARLLDVVATARARIRELDGAAVLDGPGVDPTKLVVLLAGTGAHGVAVEADLIRAGCPVEMADRDTLVAMVTLADDHRQAQRLVDVARRLAPPPSRPAPAGGGLGVLDGRAGRRDAAAGRVLRRSRDGAMRPPPRAGSAPS